MKCHKYRAGFLLLALIGLALNTFGQRNSATGARAIAMAGTSVLLNDSYGLFNNPGSMESNTLSLASSFNTNYISLGINDAQIGLVIPYKKSVWGGGVNYYGDNIFNQLDVSGAMSHKIGFARLGLRLNYHQFYLENYGYKRSTSLDLGGNFDLSDQVSLGMLMTNLTRSKLDSESSERLNSILKIGLSYRPLEIIRIDIQVSKSVKLPVSGSLGIEYQVTELVSARTGFDFTSSIAALGVGFSWSQFQFDLAGQYQPDLGFSGALSIIIRKKSHD